MQWLECYLSSTEDKQWLKKFSETRWSQHDLCLLDKYHELLSTFDLIQQVRDSKARSMAGSLSKALDSFPFFICAVVCQKLLQYLTPVSNYLQAPAVDLVKASSQASQLVSFLETKRQEDKLHYESLWDRPMEIAEEDDITAVLPRTVQRQMHRSNTLASTPKKEYCTSSITWSMSWKNNHACDRMPRLKAQFLLPSELPLLSDELWSQIKNEYSPLMPEIQTADSKLEVWKHKLQAMWRPMIYVPALNTLNPCVQIFTPFSKFCWPCPF